MFNGAQMTEVAEGCQLQNIFLTSFTALRRVHGVTIFYAGSQVHMAMQRSAALRRLHDGASFHANTVEVRVAMRRGTAVHPVQNGAILDARAVVHMAVRGRAAFARGAEGRANLCISCVVRLQRNPKSVKRRTRKQILAVL